MPDRPVLEVLNLPQDVQHLYRQLRNAGGLSLRQVADGLGMPLEDLVAQIDLLVTSGVVGLTGDVVHVVPSSEAIGLIMRREAEALLDSAERLNQLSESVRALGASDGQATRGPGLGNVLDGEVLDEPSPIEMIESWIAESPGQLMFLRPDQWRLPSEPRLAEAFRRALAQGRRVRGIYPVQALHEARSVLTQRAEMGEEIRLLPVVPTRLGVVGENRALMPVVPGTSSMRTTVLRDPGLVAMMAAYFEELWNQGVALPHLSDGGARDDWRQLLLTELAEGARDEQIARRLGLGLRTVRRRVANLMLELGVETRFQAGVEAVRRGWI